MSACNHYRRVIAAVTFLLCAPTGSAAADTDSLDTRKPQVSTDSLEWLVTVFPNSRSETYLRYLQVSGAVPAYPWGLRGFSPSESRRLAVKRGTHPRSRSDFSSAAGDATRLRLLPLVGELRGNSAFPYGSNDGAVWAGRGLTASVTGGIAFPGRPLSLVLAPTAFISQNAGFALLENGQVGDGRFADGRYASSVDRPQRFGDAAYGRIDPGNSTLRADIAGTVAGVSTANMVWGPMELYPFVLGANAAGIAHAFVGTARPINVGIGRLHGRVIWGRLDQSAFSPAVGEDTYVSVTEPGTRRFASGALVSFLPRAFPGLELGAARFFHSPWPRSGIPASYLTKPFENILKGRLPNSPEFADPAQTAENQLISAFARWVFPGAGFEMYGEYGRDDHSWDKRDFVQEPDHSRAYGLGLRKTVRLRANRMDGVTFELINFQLPHLDRTGRGEGSIYTHTIMRQGHTQRGQMLGSDVGLGTAAGSTLRWDAYYPDGSHSVSLKREVRGQQGAFHRTGSEDPQATEVRYAIELERSRRIRRLELTAGIALIHDLNRNFSDDATGLSISLSARAPLGIR